MKTMRRIEEESLFDRYDGIPGDVWLEIFGYMRLLQKYRWATVCKAWGLLGGLIDQSVTALPSNDQLFAQRLAGMPNLQSLCCKYEETVEVLPGLCMKNLTSLVICVANCPADLFWEVDTRLPKLEHLRFIPREQYELARLHRIKSLTLENGGRLWYSHMDSLRGLTRLSLLKTRVDRDFFTPLTLLRRLKLVDTQYFHGFSALTGLARLSLHSGTELPYTMFDSLTNLTQLNARYYLRLSAQVIQRLPALRSLAFTLVPSLPPHFLDAYLMQLTRLVLHPYPCYNTAHYRRLHRLTNLRSLELPFICDISVLHTMTSLIELSLPKTGSSALPGLTQHTTLTYLNLSGACEIEAYAYAALPLSLCELDLTDAESFRPEVYDSLTRLTRLKRLTLREGKEAERFIKSQAFAAFKELRVSKNPAILI